MESNYLVSCELWEFGGADCRLLLFFFADHTWLTHQSHWMVVISALPGGIDNRVCKDCVTAKHVVRATALYDALVLPVPGSDAGYTVLILLMEARVASQWDPLKERSIQAST